MKDGHTAPNMSHYKCYEVVDGSEIGVVVSLEDQFSRFEDVTVGRPSSFCVPVEKRLLTGEVWPNVGDESYLTVYNIEPIDTPDIAIGFADQFDETRSVEILHPVALAVESVVLSWREE